MAMPNIFNTEKSDYKHTSMFLGQPAGIFDTIHKNYPTIWKLYKGIKSLDWDENEFDYSSCNAEFKSLPKALTQKMIKSLAWQWETDSVASNHIAPIVSLFDPCTEVWAAWQRIGDSETTHSATYSEITRLSFDNPHTVLNEVLSVNESITRLGPVIEELAKTKKRGLQYQLGVVPNDQETYNAIFMFVYVLWVMERVQFMASFAVTFALGEEGHFMPICKAVQKICQDEYEIHVDMDREVLTHELQTDRGREAYRQLKPRMEEILNAVVQTELNWNGFLFEDDDGTELRYLNKEGLDKWVLFSATNIARPLALDMQFPQVENNPLPYMKSWTNIADTQSSPMEEDKGDYRVNIMTRDDDDIEFDMGF